MTSRRQFFGYAGAAAAGAAVTGGAVVALDNDQASALVPRTISPYGVHQVGIAAPTPAHAELVAFRLATDKAGLGRLMRLWTGDIVALSAGRGAPGDPAPELAAANKGLTVTVGFGARVFALAGHPARGLEALPVMRHDRLEAAWSGGDLLAMVGADDPLSVVHAVRQLIADAKPFATPVWRQLGFWDGSAGTGRTCSVRSTGPATRPVRTSTTRCGRKTAVRRSWSGGSG
ncbi:Dyp-type peroxidase domain-containing protein [Kribbella sp. NPDC026611]|uniref:Dyp-type peroxidase n=1 Tax=Kribbella sp. NPDC026611 TaxID=3154911 RepID=UPI0033DD280E